MKWKWKSVMSDSLRPHRSYSPWNSPGQNTGVGSLSLLQGIFPTQGSNPGLPHCRQILYQLSHQGSLRTLKWVAYPFCRGSSQPRNWTRVSCIAGGFFTSWATGEAPNTIWRPVHIQRGGPVWGDFVIILKFYSKKCFNSTPSFTIQTPSTFSPFQNR